MKKCVVICNPNSGHTNKKNTIEKFGSILEKKGYSMDVRYTKYQGHAISIMKGLSDKTDLVLSVGGDGTFNEVITGNLERKNKLVISHIPLGTANDLGNIFGMTKNPINSLKLILDGEIRNIDICYINNKPFVYVAALGKFVDVAYDTPRKLKKKIGYFAYVINAIKSFRDKTHLFEMTYEANGEQITGLYSLALICNARRIGGFEVFKEVKMDDSKFEVLLTNITRKKDIIRSLYYLATNDITKLPGFYFFRTDHLKIKLKETPRKNWCLDGEKYKSKEKEFDITINKETRMLLPKTELKNIFTNEK